MRQNSNFVLLIIAFGLVLGQNFTIGSLVSNLLDPFGLNGSQASFTMLPLLFCGLIGALSSGIFVDKTKKYKCALQTVTMGIAFFIALAECAKY